MSNAKYRKHRAFFNQNAMVGWDEEQPPEVYQVGLLGAETTEATLATEARLEEIERRILKLESGEHRESDDA
jgi:hypothetical protein